MGLFNHTKKNLLPMAVATNDGTVEDLDSLKDGVFSEKMLGDGVAIKPNKTTGKAFVHAPISGKLVTAFPTGHAYGIVTEDGVEILVHIGIDTVNLKGKGFKMVVKQGQQIKAGDRLVEVDFKSIGANAPSNSVIIVITSGQHPDKIMPGPIKTGDKLFVIK